MTLLSVKNLRVTFDTETGPVQAVRGVSFDLGRERLGIVGESGSGKTMTGRAVLRLIRAPGRIEADAMTFDGQDLMAASEPDLRALRGRRIAMVMQDPKFSLNPVMKVGAQLMEGLRQRDNAPRAEARAKAIAALEAVQIRDPERVMDSYPHELSGGMGQRVMIAMMLIPDPDLLIADEPTSALDVTVQAEVLNILDDLVKTRGMGLIFISHDLRLVARFCDRVLVMYKGKIVEELAAKDLLQAKHPYTQGLLNCLPRIGGSRGPLPVRAVQDVSFKVEAQQSFGLVGESGSGKSTILRAICGMAPITGGQIRIDGKPLPSPRGRAFAAQVQMVFQDPYASLHPRHTVDRVLSEPLAIHGQGGSDAKIEQALIDVGLPPAFRFRYPHQLSGGQRQRVAIARALMLQPQILLLDEPTSALDASVQAETLNLLSRLRAERGLTFVMVSHDLAVIDHMCDRVLVMQNGQAVEELSREALASAAMTTPYARALFAASADRMMEG